MGQNPPAASDDNFDENCLFIGLMPEEPAHKNVQKKGLFGPEREVQLTILEKKVYDPLDYFQKEMVAGINIQGCPRLEEIKVSIH